MKHIIPIVVVFLCLVGLFTYLLKTNEVVGVFVLGENTEYSPAFDEAVFRSLEIGLSSDDVARRLGEPLRSVTNSSPGGFWWIYSKSGSGGKTQNFRIRVLHFDAQGALTQKETGLYVD